MKGKRFRTSGVFTNVVFVELNVNGIYCMGKHQMKSNLYPWHKRYVI